jgi:hypothetical protein
MSQPCASDVSTDEAEVGELGQASQMQEPSVGDLRAVEIEIGEIGQLLYVD